VSLSIPAGTHFQFRASADEALSAVAITMPPWPGAGEAEFVAGPWETTEH
jgi:mannose-6-phosphate isomerase-like protein (cupin superfamily)